MPPRAWLCLAFLGESVCGTPLTDPPQPPVYTGSEFSLSYESLIQPEDVATEHSVATDGKTKAAIVAKSAQGSDTTLVRNDIGMLYMIGTRGDEDSGPKCYAFNTSAAPQPLPELPLLQGLEYSGHAIINGMHADHYQLRRGQQGTLMLGVYVASAPPRHVLQITNQDNMAQTLSAWQMNISSPDPDIFEVPPACKIAEIWGKSELDATLAARTVAHRGYMATITRLFRNTRTLAAATETGSRHKFKALERLKQTPRNRSLAVTACTIDSSVSVRSLCGRLLPTSADHFDARDFGWVAPARDQGFCGSCWSFATAATVETAAAKSDPNSNSSSVPAHLSPQLLLDCVPATMPSVKPVIAAKGCFGGWHPTALAWIHQHGLSLEAKYQYKAVDGYCPAPDAVEGDVFIKGVVEVPAGDSSVMAATIQQYGAVIAVIQVLQDFVYYTGGIYDNPQCGQNVLSHAVSVVGFGTSHDGVDYWIAKNSFGQAWGEAGFFRMKRGVNMCGIENWAYAAVV